MSNDIKFVNTYIQTSMDLIHDYLNQILQLKTQVKILNDIIIELNNNITNQEHTIQELSNKDDTINIDIEDLKSKASITEQSLTQIRELKLLLRSKDDEIKELKKKPSKIKKPQQNDDF